MNKLILLLIIVMVVGLVVAGFLGAANYLSSIDLMSAAPEFLPVLINYLS